jgi:hypothetical protein
MNDIGRQVEALRREAVALNDRLADTFDAGFDRMNVVARTEQERAVLNELVELNERIKALLARIPLRM